MKLTLVIIHQNNRVLLGMKKRGFGAGKWNGFGGKVEAGESVEDSAKRELFEEAGIKASDMRKIGIMNFEFQGDPDILEVHLFKTTIFSGEPTESGEMKPEWFGIDNIPFGQMWPDDIHWFPLFLADKKFKGYFLFGKNNNILKFYLNEINQ